MSQEIELQREVDLTFLSEYYGGSWFEGEKIWYKYNLPMNVVTSFNLDMQQVEFYFDRLEIVYKLGYAILKLCLKKGVKYKFINQ